MTREEATKILRGRQRYCKVIADHANATVKTDELREVEAIETALSALTPPTQEQMERVWQGCSYCDIAKANNGVARPLWVKEPTTSRWTMEGKELNYCPMCQKPLTPEAWEELRKRWEALNDGKGD